MKIITTKNDLQDAINIVSKAVPPRTTLPILEGILFDAKDGRLKLIATDLELGIETTVNVDVIIPGCIVISAKTISEIVRKLPDSDVILETTDNNNIIIQCEKSKLKIMGQNCDEFPELPKIDKDNCVVFSKNTLKDMIKHTIFAVSTDEIRPILTGVLFENTINKLSFVALDGYRMAVKWVQPVLDVENKIVIPSKTLSDLNKIIDDTNETVNIYFSKNHILFEVNETIIISRLLDGEFINYKQLIPSDYKIRVKVNKAKLMNACDRAALFAKDSSNNMIKFQICDDIMIIDSNSESGDVHEELYINKTGEDIDIAFNAKYIIDALKVIESEEVYLDFNTNVSPSIIRPITGEDFLYLVLPVRLKNR